MDKHVQWSQAGNIWQNAAIRTALYTVMTPLRWVRAKLGRPNAENNKDAPS
jgi:hypothetical protein